MGIQKGALKLKGTNGDLTFTETIDGFIWKKKKLSVTKERIQNDPQFEKVRHNIAEFGRTGKAVKLIREAFYEELVFSKDRRLTPRMQTALMRVVKAEAINDRGLRTVEQGPIHMMERFELNGNAVLHQSLPVPFHVTYDRATGDVSLTVPSFVPGQTLIKPQNSNRYTLVLAAAEFNFPDGTFERDSDKSVLLPIDMNPSAALTLDCSVNPGSQLPVIIVVGIQFSEFVNGKNYPEKLGEYNALAIVKTDAV